MIDLQQDMHSGSRRALRQAIPVISQAKTAQKPNQRANKTKLAICFLCLFDGLRTPSLRRLVRKAKTICNQPLVTFDPSYFAPDSELSLETLYLDFIKCPSIIRIDPSVTNVLQDLRDNCSNIPPQRVIVHYYGHGCFPPSPDGIIFFFRDDRSRYKPLNISNLLNQCFCPLCLILDCPHAAALQKHLEEAQENRDLFAFFACGPNESLPLSTDAPMDLFSSCLLSPYSTALWYHNRQHKSVFEHRPITQESCHPFLKNLLTAILDGIFFETQPPEIFDQYWKDPAMLSLARGFIFSQRVMRTFGINPSSIPQMKSSTHHPLWGVWDIALDSSFDNNFEEMIFSLAQDSYQNIPTISGVNIFYFFAQIPSFAERASSSFLNILDSIEGCSQVNIRHNYENVPSDLMQNPISKLSNIFPKTSKCWGLRCANSPLLQSLLKTTNLQQVLAFIKIISFQETDNFQAPPNALYSKNDLELKKAALLSMCCALIQSTNPIIFSKHAQLCMSSPIELAPWSAIYLSQLVDKNMCNANIPSLPKYFLSLISSPTISLTVSALLMISYSQNENEANELIPFLNPLEMEKEGIRDSPSKVLHNQALISATAILRTRYMKKLADVIKTIPNEPENQNYIKAISVIKLVEQNKRDNDKFYPGNYLTSIMIQEIRKPGFANKISSDFFNI